MCRRPPERYFNFALELDISLPKSTRLEAVWKSRQKPEFSKYILIRQKPEFSKYILIIPHADSLKGFGRTTLRGPLTLPGVWSAWKIDMEPEKHSVVEDNSNSNRPFLGFMLSFPGVAPEKLVRRALQSQAR